MKQTTPKTALLQTLFISLGVALLAWANLPQHGTYTLLLTCFGGLLIALQWVGENSPVKRTLQVATALSSVSALLLIAFDGTLSPVHALPFLFGLGMIRGAAPVARPARQKAA